MKTRGNSFLHQCDRFLGIPLVFLLGKLREKKQMPKEVHTIGLLCTAAIGDTVLLSATIADLRRDFPSASIIFFTGPSNYEAALLIPGIQVIKLPVTAVLKSIRMIRAYPFDLWVDFGQWPRINAIYSYFARARYKVGFETPEQFRHYVYDRSVCHQRIHELDNYRRLVRAVGVQSQGPPTLSVEPLERDLSSHVVLHICPGGSRGVFREWPTQNWVKLINYLLEKNYHPILTGAPADWEKCEALRKASASPDKIEILAGKASLRETAAVLKSAYAVISVETGIMHLAAALGCPTLALHGPSSPKRWGGVGPKVIPITPQMTYMPCVYLGFEKTCSDNRCMRAISVEQVISSFERLRSEDVGDDFLARLYGINQCMV